MKIDLKLIAMAKCHEPMSTWPPHEPIKDHLSTSYSGRTFDDKCLRCWIERVVQEQLSTPVSSSYSTTEKSNEESAKEWDEVDKMLEEVNKIFDESRKVFEKMHKTTSGIWKDIKTERKNGNK